MKALATLESAIHLFVLGEEREFRQLIDSVAEQRSLSLL